MKLGEFLVSKNIISQEQLNRSLKYQENWGGKIGEAMINLKIITEDQLLASLKYHLNLPVVNLENIEITPEILRLIQKETAKKYKAVPIKVGEVSGKKTLFVAMENPLDLTAVEELQFASGLRVQPVLSKSKGLLLALNRFYGIDVGFLSQKPEEVRTKEPDSDGMTIIRAGDEVTIKDVPPPSEKAKEPVPPVGPVKEKLPPIEPGEEDPLAVAFLEEESMPSAQVTGEAPPIVPVAEEPGPVTPPVEDEQHVPMERKILQALIRLLIEKGHITLAELQEKMKE